MHKPLVFDLPHEDATQKLAATFGEILVQGDVVYLRGPLGVGKSTFTRWVIRHLMENPDQVVPSPTFTLVQTYETKPYPLWHFDLYRLKDPMELFELGFEEALGRGISFIEWPEKAQSLGIAPTITLDFEELGSDHRRLTVTPHRPIREVIWPHADSR